MCPICKQEINANCNNAGCDKGDEKKESQIEKSLREMYELGVEHGSTMTRRDLEIEKLQQELSEMIKEN